LRVCYLLPFCALASLAAAQHARAPGDHWSYRPVVRPATPAVADATWCRSPLDQLVLAAMQAQGLRPSPPADRATWLRRVSFDLTGLPPTPADADAFTADTSPGAEARVVDRLLARPSAAERWAQWWLDLARYADSQGYEKDELRRSMWRYRDWVIDAFSRDMPFDQFTIEQLAGDLLPNPTDDQRLATALHRQTMTNTEGGTDDEEFRTAAVIDRVDTTMSVWMASTLGCAQCHDHKYDPFSQREFYELFAFFDQTEDSDRDDDAPVMRAPTERDRAATKVLELELSELRASMRADDETVQEWAGAARSAIASFHEAAPRALTWHMLGPVPAADFHAAHVTVFAPERDGVQLEAQQEGLQWRAEQFEDGKVHKWSGDNSAFYLYRTIEAQCAATAVLSLGSDDAIKVWWNGAEVLDKEVAHGAAPDQQILAVPLQPGPNTLLLKVANGRGPSGFYFDLRASELGAEVETVLAAEACDEKGRGIVHAAYLRRAPQFASVRERIAAAEAQLDEHRGPAVPVMRELPAGKRRTTRIHLRGSFLTQGDEVSPTTPKVWPGLGPDAPQNRLGFARWLVSRDNPLTARVQCNRIWSELFGHGLVGTLEDFGSQGDAPSHPELLDWLAAELVDGGWSLRHLLRTIVLSATYAQSSAQTPLLTQHDPDNRWLARGPAVRLSAEMLRDQALDVSGLLRRQVGGPSVMPPQPDGVWLQLYSGEKWVAADGDDSFRRSLYTFWRRTSPHPAMMVFDAQSRESCVLRRHRTNTPLQALVLWNEPQYHEAAKALARELVCGDECILLEDPERIVRLWRRCLLREPTAAEQARLLALLRDEQQRFRADPEAAAKIFPPGSCSPEIELAPWAVVAGVVLSLDEFVTKR